MFFKSKTETSMNNNDLDVRKITRNTFLIGVIVIASIAILLTTVITGRAEDAIRSTALRLIAANTNQLQMNINSYFDKVETTSALLFSDEKYYEFDATDDNLNEYDRIMAEDAILSRIVDLGIMENFTDFVIIYADNSHVGWLSNTTKDLFGNDIYQVMESYITNEKSNDGWFDGYNDYYDRLYYVKRLNPNAVLAVSFYARELETAFDIPDELEGITIQLVDESNRILYSSNRQEMGDVIPEKTARLMRISTNAVYMDKDYALNISPCDNGWSILCHMSLVDIVRDIERMRRFTFIFGAIIIIAFCAAIIAALRRVEHPLDNAIESLNEKAVTDGLSGLYNKVAFENEITKVLKDGRYNVAFVMMDMDHFKNVNDTKGHAFGDEVIVRMANVLKRSLRDDTIIGRLGGDEFAFMFSDNGLRDEHLKNMVVGRIEDINQEFRKEFASEIQELNISLSLGIYCASYKDQSFAKIYSCADRALYISKERGRNCFTVYEDSMEVTE